MFVCAGICGMLRAIVCGTYLILRLFYGYFVPAWAFVFPYVSYLFFLTPPVSASGQDLEAASLQRCDRQVAASFMKTRKTLPFSFIMTTGLHGVPASCPRGLQGKCSDRAVRSQSGTSPRAEDNVDCSVAVSPEERDDFSS